MVLAADCPDTKALQRLALGEMSPEEVERLATHCEHCERCVAALQQLRADDTLVEARSAQPTAGSEVPSKVLDTLIERLKARRRVTAAPDVEPTLPPTTRPLPSSDNSPSPAAEGPELPQEAYPFLRPAQELDEIGRLGEYRVLKVLGHGGMGVVFLAEDIHLQRAVALKAMLPEVAQKPAARERFLREARAAAKLEHDHIVPIYQVGEDRGVPFIAMPFLKGSSLEDRLRKPASGGGEPSGAPLPLPQSLKIGREIAEGLAAAHERGLIHRDIKPANIWLDATVGDRVKILDFGLARLYQGASEQHLTQSGTILGTPAYMAPEQGRGEQVDGRADLFSLGVVLFRFCTGVQPFKGNDPLSTLMSIAIDEPPLPHALNPEIPPSVSSLVMKLLAKDPAQRPTSAREVVKVLAALEKEIGGLAAAEDRTEARTVPAPRQTAERPARPGRSAAKRKRLLLGAASAGFLAILAAGIVFFWQSPKGNPVGEKKLPHDPPVAETSPFDKLRREDIPPELLKLAGGGDSAKAPAELVAALGSTDPKAEDGFADFGISPDGKLLALSVANSKSIRLVEVPSLKEVRTIATSSGGRPRFSPDGKLVAAQQGYISGNMELVVWRVEDGDKVTSFKTPEASYTGIAFAFSPDGKFIALGTRSDPLKVYRMQPPFKEVPLQDPVRPKHGRFVFLDERTVLTSDGGKDNVEPFHRWDVSTGKRLEDLPIRNGGAHDPHLVPPGNRLVFFWAYKREFLLYDVVGNTGKALPEPSHGGKGATVAVIPGPDGQWLACRDTGGEITIRRTTDGHALRRIALPLTPPWHPGFRLPLAVAPDGRHLVTFNHLANAEGKPAGRGVVFILRLDPH